MVARVYVHVGLPKTGTSYLQRTLWRSRRVLSAAGVLVPGETSEFQRLAAYDLLGRRLGGADQSQVPGSWPALVDSVHRWPGEAAVLSEELLVHATPAVCRRVVRDLAPAEVHVLVTVRDLERAMGSMWQQNIQKGRTWTWPHFVSAVREPDRGPATAGVAFWLRYDLRRVLADWVEVLPAQRVHVVVVPPIGTAPDVLLARFAEAVGLDPAALDPPAKQVNASLGGVEAELLRRLNVILDGRLSEQRQRQLVAILKPSLRRTSSPTMRVPKQDLVWIAEAGRDLVAHLAAGDHHVVGNVEDLLGESAAEHGSDHQVDIGDRDLADAALRALAVLGERCTESPPAVPARSTASDPSAAIRLSSAMRALAFRIRVRSLQAADDHPAVARLVGLYLRRRSRAR